MLTLTQSVGLLIAVALTIMFLMIGYQIIQILQELKKTIQKANHILDDANKVSTSVSEPIVALSGFLSGLREGSTILRWLISLRGNRKPDYHDE